MELKRTAKKILVPVFIALFWILVWQLLAIAVNLRLDNDFALLPTPLLTFKALISLMGSIKFYKVILYSLIRVTLGVVLGVAGCLGRTVFCFLFQMQVEQGGKTDLSREFCINSEILYPNRVLGDLCALSSKLLQVHI